MRMQLHRLTLNNFKGLKKKEFIFPGIQHEIRGANGTGKTTIFDSFLWLLFDKDSTGRKDFEIKPLDPTGKTKKDIECSVEGEIEIDGTFITIKKIYREKWVRKRGSKEDEFTGNETTYFWNEVPMKKEEYNRKIMDNIGDDETFRLLSDIRYFNSLTWQARRQMLFDLVTEKQEPDEFEIKHLKNKTADELRRELAASKKKLLTEIDQCPIRIDELQNQLPDTDTTKDDRSIRDELATIDSQLTSQKSATQSRNSHIRSLTSRKTELFALIEGRKTEIKNNLKKDIDTIDQHVVGNLNRKGSLERELRGYSEDLKDLDSRIDRQNKELEDMRDKYAKISEETFNGSLSCPTCGSDYKEEKKDEILAKFNTDKSNRLNALVEQSKEIKDNINRFQTSKIEIDGKFKTATDQLETCVIRDMDLVAEFRAAKDKANTAYADTIKVDEKIKEYDAEIVRIDTELSAGVESTDNTILMERRNSLSEELDAITEHNFKVEQRKKILTRIEELENERLKYLEKLSEVEKTEFELADYTKRQIDKIENSLRDMFDGVEFKMFDTQINGGLSPTCVVMRNGVPYSDLNTASKVWVSLLIIKAFSSIRQLEVPVFIDNRESVTEIPDMPQQVISLVVDPSQKSLKFK